MKYVSHKGDVDFRMFPLRTSHLSVILRSGGLQDQGQRLRPLLPEKEASRSEVVEFAPGETDKGRELTRGVSVRVILVDGQLVKFLS